MWKVMGLTPRGHYWWGILFLLVMEHIISELPQASWNQKKKKEKKQHATTLFEALATVKKERKYIFLYVLISAWLNNYSRWISFIRVTRDKENAFFPHCSGFYTKIRLLSFEIKSNTSYTSFKPSIWQHGKSIPGKLIILHSCKATCEISNSFFFLSFKTSLSNQLWVNTDDIKKKEV